MLAALADGRALPATDLARCARIAPTAATAHLHRLIDGGLIRVRELADRILGHGLLSPASTGQAGTGPAGTGHVLTDVGRAKLAELGIDPGPALRSRRALARPCLDWTQRRPHLAGAMPAAITARLLDLRLLTRTAGRGLRPAADYQARIDGWLRPL